MITFSYPLSGERESMLKGGNIIALHCVQRHDAPTDVVVTTKLPRLVVKKTFNIEIELLLPYRNVKACCWRKLA